MMRWIMMVMVMMIVIITIITESPPSIRICSPGVIIPPPVRIGLVIGPKIDLLACDQRIAVIHFAERFDPFSLKFSGHRNPSPLPVNIRI